MMHCLLMSQNLLPWTTALVIALGLSVAPSAAGCRGGENSTSSSDGGNSGTGGEGANPPVEPKPLTIVTWNVKNFVNSEFDGNAPNEFGDSNWPNHRAAVADVLRDIAADIVVLQEVEHEAVLNELNDELGAAYAHLAVTEGNDPRGIDIAAMSKIELDEVQFHADDTFTKVGTQGPAYSYARDCLELHTTFNGRHLALLGVHYKSKENDNPDKRLAEAQRTRAIADAITEQDATAAILILGDFNDTPGSLAYDWTIGEAPDLWGNAAELLPAEDRWTFNYFGNLELVDQQMANPVLLPMLDDESVVILQDAIGDDTSDHAPLIATYNVN